MESFLIFVFTVPKKSALLQILSLSAHFFLCVPSHADNVEAELLHTFTKVYKFDTMLLLVRLAVLTAVTLTVPIVLFPVSTVRCKHAPRVLCLQKNPQKTKTVNMRVKFGH